MNDPPSQLSARPLGTSVSATHVPTSAVKEGKTASSRPHGVTYRQHYIAQQLPLKVYQSPEPTLAATPSARLTIPTDAPTYTNGCPPPICASHRHPAHQPHTHKPPARIRSGVSRRTTIIHGKQASKRVRRLSSGAIPAGQPSV